MKNIGWNYICNYKTGKQLQGKAGNTKPLCHNKVQKQHFQNNIQRHRTWPKKPNLKCSWSSTWAGESNSLVGWAGVSSWVWGSTVQENRLVAFTLELFGPHWSLHFSIERPLEDWRSPTAKLPTDHLCILLVKVTFTHWDPRLIRLHLHSAWTLTSPIHQPHWLWKERERERERERECKECFLDKLFSQMLGSLFNLS